MRVLHMVHVADDMQRYELIPVTCVQARREFLRVPGVRLQSTASSTDGYSMGSSSHDSPIDPASALLGNLVYLFHSILY